MVEWTHDWMHGWVNALVGRLLVAARAYGRLSHARGPTADRLTGFAPRQRPSRSTTNKKRTHTLKQPCMQSSIQPYVRTLTHHTSIHPPHALTHRTSHPLQPFTHTIHQPIHSITIHSSTHPPTHLSTPSIYSSIYPHSHPLLLLLLLFLLLFLLLLLLLVLVFLFLLLLFHVLLSPSSYLHFRSIQLHSALAPTIPPRNSPFTNPSVHQPHRPTMDESEATVSRQLPTTGIHYL